MAGETIFVTGGTGHLGYQVILKALEAGYTVRAAVRSQSKANKILSAPSIKALNPGNRLQFATVEDMLTDGAYNEAIKGAIYAIHVASPITYAYKEGDDYDEVFKIPALKGTMNLLEAAQQSSTIKRVVITSSIVAIIPWSDFISGTSSTIYNENSRTPTPSAHYANVFEAYSASKVAALNETEKWVDEKKPAFDVAHIYPAFIIGADELASTVEEALAGTNAQVTGPASGKDMGPAPGASIHVEDVARAHVKALDPALPPNQGYVLASMGLEGTRWEDVFEIVRREFPDKVGSGGLRNDGAIATLAVKIDERSSEERLGWGFKGYEEQVKSAVGGYLALARRG
ncbi:NAD(P)-binding protein [Polyplosphaeria fusca]|uniref:NAD(P)-binding protein n=1 Tax=Polyplosphaeria fusca TaxID=682080 RepID=A0A9P4QP56_9PLEO|nr:NAD(P)-binding protein [Polyplosphaeria fusca]